MTLVHRLRPAAGDPEGALILLHGRGADENDLYGLLDVLDPQRRLLGVTPGAPLTNVPPGGRHWYLVERVGFPEHDTFHAAYGALTEFLDGLLVEHDIAWEHVAVGGFSMGCVMSYATALGPGRPLPAALLGFSGFVPTVDGWEPAPAGREALDVLITHGRNDPVIGVHFARLAAELLTAGGLEPEYIETDAGHFIPPEPVERARSVVARVGVG